MKKVLSLMAASLILVCGFSVAASAQTRSRQRSVNNRQQRQQQRIVHGARSGELTAQETYRLERQQAQIRRTEARYRHSGDGLSPRERYNLERRLNRSSRRIHRQTRDGQNYDHHYYHQHTP